MINNNNYEQLSDCSIGEENPLEPLDELDEKLLSKFSDKLLINSYKSISDLKDIEDMIEIKRKSPLPGTDQPSITAVKNLFPVIKDTETPTTIKARIEKNHSQQRILEMIETQIYTNLVGKMQQNIDKLDAKINDDDEDIEKVTRKVFSMTDSQIEQLSNLPSLELIQQNSHNFYPMNGLKYKNPSTTYGNNKTSSLCSLDSQPFNMPLIQSKFNSNTKNEVNKRSNMEMNNMANSWLRQGKSGLGNSPPHFNNDDSNDILDLYEINKDMQSYQNFSSVLGNFLIKF